MIAAVLNQVLGADHFPINVEEVARQYSASCFPNDPITLVKGSNLPGFDGALYPAPPGKKGWGIIYNDSISSLGRINFTLAHEFGHYLQHRFDHPKGLQCGQKDVARWDPSCNEIEYQANKFAAALLMPLDDFRRQISPKEKVDLDAISHCKDRYRVSLIAAILRWLDYTERRAVLVVSRDGYIDWARSSAAAMKSKTFFRTSNALVSVPVESPTSGRFPVSENASIKHPPGVWFPDEVEELTIYAEKYDFFISLLLLEDTTFKWAGDYDDENDAFDLMRK